jgi:hypothetical protein
LVVLRTRRDDSNPTPGDVVLIFFEPLPPPGMASALRNLVQRAVMKLG